MDTLPYEVQLALVLSAMAFVVGGLVSLFGAPLVFSAAGHVARFTLRHRMVTSLGLSALGGAGAWMGGMLPLPGFA